jgi:hypothetical protein
MLSQVDFKTSGLFFPNKNYQSVKDAQRSLEFNKEKLSIIYDACKT